MIAYVTQRGSTEQCVTQSMKSDIGIAVSEQSESMRYLYAAEPQVTALDEAVDIKSVAYAKIRYIHDYKNFIYLRPNISLSPSMSNVSVKRSVWSSGDVCAVAII